MSQPDAGVGAGLVAFFCWLQGRRSARIPIWAESKAPFQGNYLIFGPMSEAFGRLG